LFYFIIIIQFEIFLVLGMLNDFLLKCGHSGRYSWSFQNLFNLLPYQACHAALRWVKRAVFSLGRAGWSSGGEEILAAVGQWWTFILPTKSQLTVPFGRS
jgi:hypothetical protein